MHEGVATSLAVERADGRGQRLVVGRLEHNETLMPGLVAQIVEGALAMGWSPTAAGQELRIERVIGPSRFLPELLLLVCDELRAGEPLMAVASLRSAAMLAPRSREIARLRDVAERALGDVLPNGPTMPAATDDGGTLAIGLGPSERRTCGDIERAIRNGALADRRAVELGLSMLRDPDDRALRLVYADWLEERGHPRGELIALQCRRGEALPSAREIELERAFGRRYLGILAFAGGFELSGGFAERGRLGASDPRELAAWTGHPRWATVRVLDVSFASFAAPDAVRTLVAHPTMRLDELTGAPS